MKFVEKVHKFQIWIDAEVGTIGEEDGHRKLIESINPVLFVDSRQKPEKRIGALPYLKERGIPIKFVNSINIHSSDIKRQIVAETHP